MEETKEVKFEEAKAEKGRDALEAWVKNFNLWCHDQAQSGWQNAQK